ncbi:MAG: RNA 3'-terminal phosphate cyclase [Candidatus Bathyarchaeota archaeon]
MLVEIDGSLLEGGGQILRVSAALSAVTGTPLRIFNVRAKRSPSGLRPQHLAAVRSVTELTNAEVQGFKIGSREVEFTPRSSKGGVFLFDIGSAGSVTLTLQAFLPTATFASTKVEVEIHGGTNNPWAPPIEYLQSILFPTLNKIGFKGSVTLVKRGFYPTGGGIVKVNVEPTKKLNPLEMVNGGKVLHVSGISHSSKLPSHIVERMAKAAGDRLKGFGIQDLEIITKSSQPENEVCAIDSGCGIFLLAELDNGALIGSDSLGSIGKPAEKVGREVADNLIRELETGASVDRHLADQLIIWMSLADGISTISTSELTSHTATCIEICRKFIDAKFEVEGKLGEKATIKCHGVGFENKFS